PDAPTGMVYPGDLGISRSTYDERFKNFGPRFGFAWDPLKNGRLSVRGGYGILYDGPDAGVGTAHDALPFYLSATVRNTDYANPWAASLTSPIPQPFPFQPAKPGDRFDFARYGTLSFQVIDPHFATPYTQQWSLQIQSRIRKDWLLETGYTGSVGVKLYNI